MKKYIYLICMLCTAIACSSPTSSNSDDDQDPTIPPVQTEEFFQEITVSDGGNSRTLTFGLQKDLTAGYDSDMDIESPPFNPPGSFFAHFMIPEYNLFKDIRSDKSQSANWHLALSSMEDNLIDLRWDVSNSDLIGSLVLQDKLDSPNIAINMSSESSFTLDPQEYGQQLFIVYSVGKSKGNAVPPVAGSVSSNESSTSSDFDTNPASGNSSSKGLLEKEF